MINEKIFKLGAAAEEAIYVYSISIEEFLDDKSFNELYQKIPLFKKNKIDSLTYKDDKVRSLLGWELLSYALSKKELYINDYQYQIAPDGKPELINYPYKFNISHSGKYVVLALYKKDIGIDIQQKKPFNPGLIDRLFNLDDKKFYNKAVDKVDAFYYVWCIKESYSKLDGKGLRIPFNSILIDYKKNLVNKHTYVFYDIDNEYKVVICY